MSSKIALITGGNRGLGKDAALALAAKGIAVVITYNTNKAEAEAVVAEIERAGQKAAALQLNVAEISGFDSFFGQLKSTLENTFNAPHFDFLINNAGAGFFAGFDQTTEAQFDELLNLNFKGPYFFTQKALALITDGGSIVNLSTSATRVVLPGFSAYAAMKGALETVTSYLTKELGARGIRANAVLPGAIETDFAGGVVRDNADLNGQIALQTALGRVGKPDDIGSVVAFLCSDDAKWIDGQRIEVTGGWN